MSVTIILTRLDNKIKKENMMTLMELATMFGVSRERVRQIIEDGSLGDCKDVDRSGNAWAIGRDTTKKFLEARGIHFSKTIATIASMKGGIGKTTLTATVAVRAANLGASVLIVDLDPEACATNYLSKDPITSEVPVFVDIVAKNKPLSSAIIKTKYDGIDIVPSSLRNHQIDQLASNQNPKKLIKDKLKGLNYDIVFLELPPSWTAATRSAYLAADLIILPCTPNVFALESVALTIESVDKLASDYDCPERNYRVLMNQFNTNRAASQQVLGTLISNFGDRVYPVYIKESADINNATNAGQTVYESKSSKEIKKDFSELTARIFGLEVANG